jgi:hypothetical protein
MSISLGAIASANPERVFINLNVSLASRKLRFCREDIQHEQIFELTNTHARRAYGNRHFLDIVRNGKQRTFGESAINLDR